MESQKTQKTIAITGASGFLGRHLTTHLAHEGYLVKALPRDGINPLALNETFAVIHLAGANIGAKRWTQAYKDEIYTSRVNTTKTLVGNLRETKTPPTIMICASAIGYYGDCGAEPITENNDAGSDFLAQLCKTNEDEAMKAINLGIRVVCPRFGIVLSHDAFAVKKMTPLFHIGLGASLGTGTQYWSFVSLVDVMRAISHILDRSDISGPVNVCAPHPSTNFEFSKALAHSLHKPMFLNVPSFAVKLLLGEIGDTLLTSCKAVPTKLESTGFTFLHKNIEEALQELE